MMDFLFFNFFTKEPKLSNKRRKEIAQKAAMARWERNKNP
jgi:hypothetical protein